MNKQIKIYKQQIEQMAKGQITLDPSRTLLLVVDMVNDGCRDEGSFKKIMNADISMFQAIEPNIIALMRACKTGGIPRICVQSIYDFAYIPAAMRQRFEAMGIQDGQIAPKGSWGSQIIDTLLAEKPEYILVKSHYSAFAKPYSLIYQTDLYQGQTSFHINGNLPETKAFIRLLNQKKKIAKNKMHDKYCISAENRDITTTLEFLMKGHPFIDNTKVKYDTIIITGGSTHVCEDAAVSSASEKGYRVIEPIDAVGSEDHEKHYVYLHNHGIFKSQLTTTAKLIEEIQKNK
jgi:nicotinamidase-related amidase